jgi:hypothetical protein
MARSSGGPRVTPPRNTGGEVIYLIDYLDMIYLRAGYFMSEEEAWTWIIKHAKGQPGWSVVTIDRARTDGVLSTRTYTRYASQR